MKTLVRSNGTLFRSMPSLFEDFLTRDWLDSSHANWRSAGATLPAVNIMETNDDYKIEVAAPGMNRNDFKVELDNSVLNISSEREHKQERGENDDYFSREFSYQSFQRSFALPENKVDGDKIQARYTDGILYVTVPKREEAKVRPAKQIKVG